mgnify:CR=1 FL=1
MDTSPSIVNNTTYTLNLPPVPNNTIPPISNNSSISNITSSRNNFNTMNTSIYKNDTIMSLIGEKDKMISSLRDTNINLAQMVFDFSDKLIETNEKINDEISKSLDSEDEELKRLKSTNINLKNELMMVKGELKELNGSYNHLNSIFVHNIPTKDTRNLISPTKFDKIKEDYEALKEKLNCRICFDNKINTIIKPCNHTVLCIDCINNMRAHTNNIIKCPICNQIISGFTRIYLPI